VDLQLITHLRNAIAVLTALLSQKKNNPSQSDRITQVDFHHDSYQNADLKLIRRARSRENGDKQQCANNRNNHNNAHCPRARKHENELERSDALQEPTHSRTN
jgi:hypothetical protein